MKDIKIEAKNELSNFIFEDKEIRSVTDESGEVWFVLRDVLDVMDRKGVRTNEAQASILEGLGEGYVRTVPLQTTGGIQQVIIVNEPAITFLVARSNTEQGKKLNRWIHIDILPSIRKTGKYELSDDKMIIDKTDYQKLLNESVVIPRSSLYIAMCVEEYMSVRPNIREAVDYALHDISRNVKQYRGKILSDSVKQELDDMIGFLQKPVQDEEKGLISVDELQKYFGFQRKSMDNHLLSAGIVEDNGGLTTTGAKMARYIDGELWFVRDTAFEYFLNYAKTRKHIIRKHIIKRVHEALGVN